MKVSLFLVSVAEVDEPKNGVILVDNPVELENLLHAGIGESRDLFDFNVSLVLEKYVDYKDITLGGAFEFDNWEFDNWFWRSGSETREMLNEVMNVIKRKENLNS